MPEFVKVAPRSELPPGGKLLAEVDGRAIDEEESRRHRGGSDSG